MYFLMTHYKYVSHCLTQTGFQNVTLKSSKIVKQSLLVLEIFSLLLNYLQGMHAGNTSRAPLSLGMKPNFSASVTTLFFLVFFFFFFFIILLLNPFSIPCTAPQCAFSDLVIFMANYTTWRMTLQTVSLWYEATCCRDEQQQH